MHPLLKRYCLMLPAIACCLFTVAQTRTDTTKVAVSGGSRLAQGPKQFKDVITSKAVSDDGLFCIHKQDDKYYFEIGDTLLGREILVVNRISKAAAGMRTGFF